MPISLDMRARSKYTRDMETEMNPRAKVIDLAIGRILRIASRPTQPGDVADYERCRNLILDSLADESRGRNGREAVGE